MREGLQGWSWANGPVVCPGTLVDVRECGRDHCHNGGHPLDCVYGQWKELLGLFSTMPLTRR